MYYGIYLNVSSVLNLGTTNLFPTNSGHKDYFVCVLIKGEPETLTRWWSGGEGEGALLGNMEYILKSYNPF